MADTTFSKADLRAHIDDSVGLAGAVSFRGAADATRVSSVLTFDCGADVDLTPVSFSLVEALSEPYEARIILRSREAADRLASIVLGQPARLGFGGEGSGRSVRGIVKAVEARGTSTSLVGAPAYVEIVLVPKLALLATRKTSRVFQDVPVMDVVDEILREWGIPRRWALSTRPTAWPYNVQHQQSDLDFLRAILAAEGIFFFFEDASDDEAGELCDGVRVVFGDSSAVYAGLGGAVPELFPAVREDRSASGRDRLFRFAEAQRLSPSSVLLRDYTALQAHADTAASATATISSGPTDRLRTHYEYLPSRPVDGQPHLGRVALEQLRRDARTYRGEAAAPKLSPGHLFHVERQSDASLDGAYVVTSLRTRGHDPLFSDSAQTEEDTVVQELAAIRASDVLRPARMHREAHHGFDTAVVVGPSNTPVVSDALGRVRVRFSWDHDRPGIDAAAPDWSQRSAWIRVAQPWSGAGHGAFFLPRVGSEVLVGYIGGDINRPVIVGSMPNSAQPPPFSLPADAGLTGIVSRGLANEGQSELVFDDTGGRESARLVSQRKLELRARQDLEQRAGRNELTEVVEASTLTVGHARRESVGGERVISVGGASRFEAANDASASVAGRARLDLGVTSVHCRDDATLSFDRRLEWTNAADVRFDVAGTTSFRHDDVLFVSVGTPRKSASHVLHVEGSSTHEVTGPLEISSDQEIVLRSGDSSVRISPKAVEIRAPKIRVDADTVEIVGDALQLDGAKFARINAPKVFALASGASLSLTSIAKLDGSQVKLGTPPDASDGPEAKTAAAPPTSIKLVDQDGLPIAGERCVVKLADGTSRAAVTNSDGVATIFDLVGSATVDFLDLSDWKKD